MLVLKQASACEQGALTIMALVAIERVCNIMTLCEAIVILMYWQLEQSENYLESIIVIHYLYIHLLQAETLTLYLT